MDNIFCNWLYFPPLGNAFLFLLFTFQTQTSLSFYFCFCSKQTHSRHAANLVPFFDCTWLCASPFLSRLRGNLRPPHIYNLLQDCSTTPGCQTIQMRHQWSPFVRHATGYPLPTLFIVQPQWKRQWVHTQTPTHTHCKQIWETHSCFFPHFSPCTLVEIRPMHYSVHMSC